VTDIVVVGVALALTLLGSFEILWFIHVYRRLTGDRSYSYLSMNQARILGLVLRRHKQPELGRLQVRIAIVVMLWLASVFALFSITR